MPRNPADFIMVQQNPELINKNFLIIEFFII
jgi:hypothetical protein